MPVEPLMPRVKQQGYDPLQDIEWLQDEIFQWILGNLKERWGLWSEDILVQNHRHWKL